MNKSFLVPEQLGRDKGLHRSTSECELYIFISMEHLHYPGQEPPCASPFQSLTSRKRTLG